MDHKYWFELFMRQEIEWGTLRIDDNRSHEIRAMLQEVDAFLKKIPTSLHASHDYIRCMEARKQLSILLAGYYSHISPVTNTIEWKYADEMRRHNSDFVYVFERLFAIPKKPYPWEV